MLGRISISYLNGYNVTGTFHYLFSRYAILKCGSELILGLGDIGRAGAQLTVAFG